MILGELNEIASGGIGLNKKPLRAVLAGNAKFFQIGVKILVRKGTVGFGQIGGAQRPPLLIGDADRVGLLFDTGHADRVGLLSDTGFHIALGKADFRPAVVSRHAGSGIGIALRNDLCRRLNTDCCHYAISFTCVSMNSISSTESPYFL